MNLVTNAYDQGQIGRARELLDSLRPGADEEDDLRSFEWYYFWGRCFQARRSFPVGPLPVLNTFALSRDGTTLAVSASGEDNDTAPSEVLLLDYPSGTLRRRLSRRESARVTRLFFSPDGSTLIVSDSSAKTALHDPKMGNSLVDRWRDAGVLRCFAFSPDSRYLAVSVLGTSTSAPYQIGLWDMRTEKMEKTLSVEWTLSQAFFAEDGKHLFAISTRGDVRCWELSSSKVVHDLKGSTTPVSAAALAPDGETLLLGLITGQVRFWNVRTGTASVTTTMRSPPKSLAVSPDGNWLAVIGSDAVIRLWEMKRRVLYAELLGHTVPLSALAFTPDSKGLVSLARLDHRSEMKCWDIPPAREIVPLEKVGAHNFLTAGLLLSDGVRLAGAWESTKDSRLWDAVSGQETNGPTLLGPRERVFCYAADRESRYLVAAFQDDGSALRWDLHGHESPLTIPAHDLRLNRMAVSPDGRYLATAAQDRSVKLWDLKSGQRLNVWENRDDSASSLCFSPDGRTLAVGDLRGRVLLHDLDDPESRHEFKGPSEAVLSLAYHPDGRYLAAGSRDNSIHVWDMKNPGPLLSLRGHTGAVLFLTFHPDGKILASGGNDNTIRLWDLVSGEERATIPRLNPVLVDLRFTRDGGQLLGVIRDGIVFRWKAAMDDRIPPGH